MNEGHSHLEMKNSKLLSFREIPLIRVEPLGLNLLHPSRIYIYITILVFQTVIGDFLGENEK